MNIFLLIYFPLLIYMFYDFRKAFLLYVLLKVFLNQNINLVNIPGLPLLTLEFFLNSCFILYFLVVQKKFKNIEQFPLKIAFIWSLISIIISTIFSIVGLTNAITRAFQDIINNYFFIYLFWRILREKKDISFLIRGFTYVFIVLGLYGIFEKIIGANPLMNYEISLNPIGKTIDWSYGDNNRLGMGRVRSAILHPIGFGVYLSVISSFYLFVLIKYKSLWNENIFFKFFLFFSSISCLFFTNSRSPLIYLFIAIIPLINLRKKRTYHLFLFILIGLLISWNSISPYFLNITSFFDKSVASEIGGSDLNMRIDQFISTLAIFSKSPLIGLGIKSMDDILAAGNGLLGGESIWIWLLVERGILGCISYLILIFSIAKVGQGSIKFFVWSSTFAWLILSTVTSTPGIEMSFFIAIILILNRIQILTTENKHFGKQI